ncbi:MAG TPA: hypothetical protein VFM24_08890 [Nitrospira sp.]|nr:hypothetical protein [Nitrospira sp.]
MLELFLPPEVLPMKGLMANLTWDAVWSLPPSEFLSLVILALMVLWVVHAVLWKIIRFFNP